MIELLESELSRLGCGAGSADRLLIISGNGYIYAARCVDDEMRSFPLDGLATLKRWQALPDVAGFHEAWSGIYCV